MTIQLFVSLFVSFSIIASLLTEAIKKATNDKLSDNLTNLVVSFCVGMTGMIVYYTNAQIPIDAINIAYAIFASVAVWVGSTIGYDKVKQALEQLGGK